MLPRQVRALLVAAAALALSAPVQSLAAQQTGTIRGTITDAASRRPVGDVQVIVVGTVFGALTGPNGEFTIANVPAGQRVVRARRLGFNPAEKSVTVTNEPVTVDFALTQSATQLEQLVVTGTAGAAERKTVGNSITQLNVADLTEKQSVLNVSEVLQSKTPGVSILPGSGAPGTAGEIRIRGASSLSGYRPVVFIDGVRYSIDDLGSFSATGGGTAGLAQSTQVTSALNFLNPNDIESIEVIKGPAAATLYGAEAANGVIQIITKKGTRGQQKLAFSMRAERGTSGITLDEQPNYTTCDAVKKAQVDALGQPLWPGCQGLADNTVITDNPWARDGRAVRDGDLSVVQVTARGGGDRYSFYFSGDRNSEQGVLFNSDNSQKSVRTNFTVNPNDQLDFTVNVNWQDGRLRLPIQDESANGLLLSAVRGLAGRASLLGPGNEGWRTISPAAANRYKNYTESDRLTLGGTLNYNPFSWFRNRATIGLDQNQSEAQLLFLPGDIDPGQDPDAASGANLRRSPWRRIVTLDYAGNILWKPTSTIETTTSFGSQVVGDEYKRIGATGIGIGAVDVTNVNLLQRTIGSDTLAENNSVGFYVQEQIGFKERLYLTAALRADDHSSFGANFDIVTYPKVSLSYVASEEPALRGFLDGARVSSLKLRGAWGQAGRAPSAFSAPQTYTVNNVTLGTTTGSAIRTATFGNPDLEAERGTEIELGFDAGMFAERLGVDFTYFTKKTSDILQSVAIAPSTGFTSPATRLTNLGEVTNKGFEVSLFGSPVQSSNFGWDTRINLATLKNELVSFGVPGKTVETPGGQAYAAVQQHRPGYPLGGYWVLPPLRAADGSALLTPAGAAQFPVGDTARRYFGQPQPTREIGFSNTFTIMRYFRIYSLFDYKGGHHIFNQKERNRCQSNDNCSRTNNPAARFPKTAADSVMFKELAVYRNASPTPEWIQKADFIKLREISLTVDIPSAWVRRTGATSASFLLAGRNLALWSDYEGTDPEVNSYGGRNFVKVDAYALPMTRRLTAGFNIQY
jgi:TonB-dependent starch-binding outer membrane protein SusC